MKIAADKEKVIAEIERYVSENIDFHDGKLYNSGTELVAVHVAKLANLLFMLPNVKYHKWANEALENCRYYKCNMTPMHVSRIYIEYNDKLSEKAKDGIVEYLRSMRDAYTGDELDFVGVNDNFPMMSTYTVAAMFKILNDKKMLNEAYRRFSQIEKLLKRRGVISEYNSDYTGFQLFIIANLIKIAPDERCRQIALNLQNRVWLDRISHFHSELGVRCGPYAREYLATGERDNDCHDMYMLFNPKVQLDLENYISTCSYLIEEYECDDEIAELINNRKFPFEFMATTECSASTDSTPESEERILEKDENVYEYSAGESRLYTYMTHYYGIGTATKEWHSGIQTSSFTLSYKRCKNPKKRGDVREVFCRYLLNDEAVKDQRFFDQGRKTAFGKKNRALVLYKPKIAAAPPVYSIDYDSNLAAHYKRQEITGNMGVTSAKLVIVIPLNGTYPDKIIANDTEIKNFTASFSEPKSVYIKDGEAYLAVHPLHISNKGRADAMTIRLRDGQLEIALYNYCGEKRNFARRDFLHVRNGFGFAVSSVEECDSFESFVNDENKTLVSDRLITTMHSRQTYVRSVEMESGDIKLACVISPASEGIKFMTYNDYQIEIPKLYVTGFDVSKLPYMEQE